MTHVAPKHIVFVSGTRADFGKIQPLASAAERIGHNVTIFVTGMHMLERYGLTKIEVQHAFENIVEFINQRHDDPLDLVLTKTISGFSDYVREAKPDLVIIHGDRVEAFSAAIVCATNYIPCAHIEGGEVSGTIDEIFRHCNSKLSNIHFVSSDVAKRRVMAMGESPERIYVIGSPELDVHFQPSGVTLDEVRERYDIDFDDYGICIFHPVTSETESMGQQATDLFATLEASGRNFVVIAPNNDPGSAAIFAVLDSLPAERFRVLPSMRFRHFSELLKNASAFIGNSSTGVREAPFLGVPSLDIGTRQNKRAMANSVQKCTADDSLAIAAFLRDMWGKRQPPDKGFGLGSATEKFVELLESGVVFDTTMQKVFVDVS